MAWSTTNPDLQTLIDQKFGIQKQRPSREDVMVAVEYLDVVLRMFNVSPDDDSDAARYLGVTARNTQAIYAAWIETLDLSPTPPDDSNFGI